MNTIRSVTSGFILVYAFLLFLDKFYLKSIFYYSIGILIHFITLYIYPLLLLLLLISKYSKKWFIIVIQVIPVILLYINLDLKFLFSYISKIAPSYSFYLKDDLLIKGRVLGTGIGVLISVGIYIYSICIFDSTEYKKKILFYIGILSNSLILFSFKITILNRVTDFLALLAIFPLYFILINKRPKHLYFKILIYLYYFIVFIYGVIINPSSEKIYNNIYF